MSLAAARVAEPQNVFLPVQKVSFQQPGHLTIDRTRQSGSIKVLQSFSPRQFRLFQPSLDASLATIDQFQFTEFMKVTRKRRSVLLGYSGLGVTVFSKRRQMQLTQTPLELSRDAAHEATS